MTASPAAPGPRLTAACALSRGFANARANWELLGIHWLQGQALKVLALVGLAPVLLVLGHDDALQIVADPSRLAGALKILRPALDPRGGSVRPAILAGLGATLLVWSIAMVVFCFCQAGILGTLAAGDRQSPPGAGRDWRFFRTFSWGDFAGWGGRYLGRFVGLLVLVFAVLGVAWATLGLLVVLAAAGGERWGAAAAVGIGCGGALPMAFGAWAALAWSSLAWADAGRGDSSLGTAVRHGLHVLGRRLPAMLLFTLLFFVAATAAAVAGLGLALVAGATPFRPPSAPVWWALGLASGLLEAMVAFAADAVLVALVRSEPRSGPVRARAATAAAMATATGEVAP